MPNTERAFELLDDNRFDDRDDYDPRVVCEECGALMDAADEPVGLCANCRERIARAEDEAQR